MKTVSVNAVGGEGFLINVAARDFNLVVDQPPAGGGKNLGANPLEYALASLGACMVTIGKIIAMQERIDLRGMSREEAQKRISTQASDEQRREIADVIIDTEGTTEQTLRQVESLWRDVQKSLEQTL